MVTTKQLNIKNRMYYFYDDTINLKNFDPKLLKLDKKLSWTLIFITSAILQKSLSAILIV